ncbi:MAG: DUF6090 family protein [Flavobacteriaceae bacterium]|nr:DUF6090 family protein [Flavobacteriaceae bacterium]
MLKFFNKIRYDLISENKTGKYLKYAIGEIILVMIGILLALQVNDWNENQLDKEREQVVLTQLKVEFKANLKQLEAKMHLRGNIVSSGLLMLQKMNHPGQAERDSVIFHLSRIIPDPTFEPIENDLISSGNIRLIRNDTLRHLLSNWSSDVKAVQEMEGIHQMQTHQILRPLLHELGITREILSRLWEDYDGNWMLDEYKANTALDLGNSNMNTTVMDILSSVRLEGIISNAVSINNAGNIESESLKNRIQNILELIERELKNN